MDTQLARSIVRQAVSVRARSLGSRRCYATLMERQNQDDIKAAPELSFATSSDKAKASTKPRYSPRDKDTAFTRRNGAGQAPPATPKQRLLDRIRIVPASPSYFTASPQFTDDVLHLSTLLRKYQRLPQIAHVDAPRVAWKTIEQYQVEIREPVRVKSFAALTGLLKRLNYIHPSVMPAEVTEAMQKYKRTVQPSRDLSNPIVVDKFGRTRAVGKRKSSTAKVTLVEGEGRCLINGRSLTEYFGRLHDRESAVWPLKATSRLDKYNVWAIAEGGGTTGQAEAITLALAKALLAHEPDLKPALRKAGCVTRDPRKVERKKPGKLKARKMPAWVKR